MCTAPHATHTKGYPLRSAVVFWQNGQALQSTAFKQAFDGLVNGVRYVHANFRPLRRLQQGKRDELIRFGYR